MVNILTNVSCSITYLPIRPQFTIKAEIHRPFFEAYVYVHIFGCNLRSIKNWSYNNYFLKNHVHAEDKITMINHKIST